MIIELLKPWRRWDAGHRMEKTGGAADVLIQRGIARAVEVGVAKAAPVKKAATKKASPKKASPKKAAKAVGNTKRTTKKASQ